MSPFSIKNISRIVLVLNEHFLKLFINIKIFIKKIHLSIEISHSNPLSVLRYVQYINRIIVALYLFLFKQ